jgi:4-hydroxy-tetrahydrodipicolinate synthase
MEKMFGRVLTAMVTPFHAQGAINWTSVSNLARYLAANGSDGIVVCGTTGEVPTLRPEEKLKLFQTVRQAVPAACRVIANVGNYSTAESVDMASQVNELGLDGVMAVVPYYNKPSQQGLFEHFQAIAAATKLPVMLYNVPGRTVTNLLPDTVARLAEIPNITALNEAAGSMDQFTELRRKLPTDFTLYSGDDSLTLPLLALGARGVVSVASHVVGLQLQRLVGAFEIGNIEEARQWHERLYPIFKNLFITTSPAPVKFVLNALGHDVGAGRLPIVPPDEQEQAILLETVELIKSLA